MFHYGHAQQFEQAKKMFKNVHLIVGISPDEEVLRLKGPLVMTELERSRNVQHCKWVDEVIMPCPWVITEDYLEKHKIDYVAHDDLPYAHPEADDIYYKVKALGKFRATQRTEGVSTTELITRILQKRDYYFERQFKRGATR